MARHPVGPSTSFLFAVDRCGRGDQTCFWMDASDVCGQPGRPRHGQAVTRQRSLRQFQQRYPPQSAICFMMYMWNYWTFHTEYVVFKIIIIDNYSWAKLEVRRVWECRNTVPIWVQAWPSDGVHNLFCVCKAALLTKKVACCNYFRVHLNPTS